MNVLIVGATGMVGQAVLRECLIDPEVTNVAALGRTSTGREHPKLREILHENLMDLAPIESRLSNINACFFTLGATSAGMSESDYTRVTYDLTMSVARTLVRLNPNMTFVFVSGAGTDSTERGRTMWARVKGKTENALLQMPFKSYMFRPGIIQPMHGVTSKTKSYRTMYVAMRPLLPLLVKLLPQYATTSERLARAMIRVARNGAPKRVLESRDINSMA